MFATSHNASLVAYQRYRDAGIINNRELRLLAQALVVSTFQAKELAWLEAVWAQVAQDDRLAA